MRKDFNSQPWLFPMPVLMVATYDENGKPDVMNAAWGGIYEENQIMLSLAQGHKTTKNIKRNGAFTVSFATKDTLIACDYAGITSANQTPDKFEKTGFHTQKSNIINAPLITELPVALECKLCKFTDDGILIGEILNVCADEAVLDEQGNIDYKKLNPLCYNPVNRTYVTMGETVGKAFCDGQKIK